jgi:hypothetical protein
MSPPGIGELTGLFGLGYNYYYSTQYYYYQYSVLFLCVIGSQAADVPVEVILSAFSLAADTCSTAACKDLVQPILTVDNTPPLPNGLWA